MLLNINRTNLSVFVNLPQMLCKHLHWFHIIQATKVAENGMLQFTPCRHAIRPTGKPKYHLHQTETCQNHKTDFDVIVSVTLLHSSGKLHNGFILSLAYRLHKRCRITDLLLNYNIYTKKCYNFSHSNLHLFPLLYKMRKECNTQEAVPIQHNSASKCHIIHQRHLLVLLYIRQCYNVSQENYHISVLFNSIHG